MLTVPDSAVIDTGTRRLVLVQVGEGRFEPREVKLGGRSENFIEIIEGVSKGEPVVVAANFLIDAESNLKAVVADLAGQAGVRSPALVSAAAKAGHQATGTVDGVDARAGTLSLNHEPVPSLKWPAMTMELKAAHTALLKGLRPGQAVNFEFVERQPGEYVVTAITAAPAATPAEKSAAKSAAKSTAAPAAKANRAPAAASHNGH